MAAPQLVSKKPKPTRLIQSYRFAAQHGHHLWYLSLSVSGNIAVSGWNDSNKTFIELYCSNSSSSRDEFQPFYSKTFEKYYNYLYRYVSFLMSNGSELVTCIGDKIEVVDAKNESKVLRSCRVGGEARCLAVSNREVFIGLMKSQTVIVFNNDLEEMRKIILKGITDDDYPRDLQVMKDTVFVCTMYGRALSVGVYDDTIVGYTNTTEKYSDSNSITVSKELGLVAALWTDYPANGIILYSLKENKPFLVFDVDADICRIRISDTGRMMISGNRETGEIKKYDLGKLFTYDDLKELLVSGLQEEDCKKLVRLRMVNKAQSDTILKSRAPAKSLLRALEKQDVVQKFDVGRLRDALIGINPTYYNIVDIYQKTRHPTIKELNEELNCKTDAWEDEKQQLLKEIKAMQVKFGTNMDELEWTKKALEQTNQDREVLRYELKQYQLKFAKESRALKEVLNQTYQAMTDTHKMTADDKPSHGTSSLKSEGIVEAEKSILAAEFGRLIVGLADSLTLDQTLQLTILFNLPQSVSDHLYRVSLYQIPGMKFLEEIEERSIINMYDVTNLQKAFAVLHLEKTKQTLLDPYQLMVKEDLHELHKAKEMLTWKDVEAMNAVKGQPALVQMEDRTIFDDSIQAEANTKPSETVVIENAPSPRVRHRHPAYIEHIIGKEGGILPLDGASLTIPPGAFLENHVIGLSITNETPFPLPREIDKARMTPVFKIEPSYLILQKPVQLIIPHFALLPKPEKYDAIIFSGEMSAKNGISSGGITWTEERCSSKHLREKTITMDIQSFGFFCASLLSQSSEYPFYIVRAVPFVDGVRHVDDDITLTVCFCGDTESDYNSVLSDYQTKLPLEQYSTIHVRRHSGTNEQERDVLRLTISSQNDSYIPDKQTEIKDIVVSHLFAASRVFHQFRLKKNQQISSDEVDLMLALTQAGKKLTEICLKARTKDLIISQKSEDLLFGSLPPALKPYEDLKSSISLMLDKIHCRKLVSHFELSPAEGDRIEYNEPPGRMLIEILDERGKIMPQKMIDLFQGLKACHLDKIARLVSEYIDMTSKEIQQKQQEKKDRKTNVLTHTLEDVPAPRRLPKKPQIPAISSPNDESVQTILSSSYITCKDHVNRLTNEGYVEQEVVNALDLSKNELDMARKVLQCIGNQRVIELLPNEGNLLYKEQYIDENGGEIILQEANIHMRIPVDALSKGEIVSITMMTSKHIELPSEPRTPQLTSIIKCGQGGITLNKPVTLRIPHCAAETEGISSTDMYLGFSNKGEEIQWRQRKKHEPGPLLKKDHFEVLVQTFCAISLHVEVDNTKRLRKRFRVVPFINRIVNPSDDLIMTLWIYNDDETEHMYLLQEEIEIGGKIQLHDFKIFTLKGFRNGKEVYIRSRNKQIYPYPERNIMKFTSTALWHNTSHRADFRFQNKEGISDITFQLRLYTKQFMRSSDDLQFDLKVTLSELLQKPRESTKALIQLREPQPAMEKSFQELIKQLSGELNVDSCLKIARIFGLSSEIKERIKESSEPGNILLEDLVHEQLISASSVSAMDAALTKTGNGHLAEYVKEYRRRNAPFPTTVPVFS